MVDGQNGIGDQSVADQLRASLKQAQEARELDLVMPRTEPGLHMLFRGVSYAEVRALTLRSVKDSRSIGPAESDKYRAAELLIAACTGCYVMNGESRIDWPPLGLALYDTIFPPDPDKPEAVRPATDREAVFMLFGSNDMDLMAMNAQYEMWAGSINAASVEELLGKLLSGELPEAKQTVLLAAHAAYAGIPFDLGRLIDSRDAIYGVVLAATLEFVNDLRRREDEENRRRYGG